MTWTPLGPTLVISPRFADYTRMARTNEDGVQAAVLDIAVHPNDETDIVAVVRRVGGSSALRTIDDGHSWAPIADPLTQANPQLDLACAARHPTSPDVVWLGARAGQQVMGSPDGGQTWPVQSNPGGRVTQLIVDPASGPDWTMATLYAATSAGVAYSTTGGVGWALAPIGEVTSLAAYLPPGGPPQFYAGVYGSGLYYAEAPGGPWQNLFGAASGLPPVPSAGQGMVVLVDYCPRQPGRVYALVAPLSGDHQGPYNVQLFVSTAAPPLGVWAPRGVGAQPPLDYLLEGIAFMAAPEPNGPDTQDVLLCSAGIYPQRSSDGGRSWQTADPTRIFHTDMRSLTHHPPKAAYYPAVLPAMDPSPPARVYVGCDGGLGASRGYSSPGFDFAGSVADLTYNGGATYDATLGLVENLNHGLASVAAYQFAGTPDPLAGGPMGLIGYVTALDTGSARRVGSPAWASVGGGDAGLIYAAQAPAGVQLWMNASVDILWPVWNLVTWVDQDPPGLGGSFDHVSPPAAASCAATSNMVPASPGDFYAGIIAFEQVTTLAAPVTPGANVTVTPAAMTPDFVVGARVCLGDPTAGVVYQPISNIGSGQFVVTIFGSGTIPAGTAVRVVRSYAARVTGVSAAPVSQVFIPQTRRLYRLAKSGDTLVAASADQRLWIVSSASTADSSTTWTEISGAPGDLSGATIDDSDITGGEYESGVEVQGTTPLITGLTADAAGTFYVMLSSPVSAVIGGVPLSTPLFRVESGAWVPEPCTLPLNATIPQGVALGEIVAHPTQPARLFAARNARLFELDKGPSSWGWTDLTDNLPGQEIHDLWIGNIAPAGAPQRLVLRAVTAVRGVWEMEIDAPPLTTAELYFRDHAFDPGWLGPSADGVASPLDPGVTYWHWQSADIKVDTPLRDSTAALYYQNDPEAPTPTAADFAWFKDRSQVASAGVTARVWVRVNNRSPVPSDTVNVWVITAPFSAGLPSLPAGFWSRFHADGTIETTSPTGWTSLGVQSLSGIIPEVPGVAGFQMPTGSQGDHRCIVAFVHGPGALLDTTGLDLTVDDVVPANPQIAQRNVLVGPPLSSSPGTPAPSTPASSRGPVGAREIRAGIDFNNPRREPLAVTVKFDLGKIPETAVFEFRLSRNAHPQAIIGAHAWSAKDGFPRWLWILVRRFVEAVVGWFGPDERRRAARRLPLSAVPYLAHGGGAVDVQGLRLDPGGKAAAELLLRFNGPLKPGAEHHLDVLQMAKDRVIGGATIVVPVGGGNTAGVPRPTEHDWRNERESAGKAESGLARA